MRRAPVPTTAAVVDVVVAVDEAAAAVGTTLPLHRSNHDPLKFPLIQERVAVEEAEWAAVVATPVELLVEGVVAGAGAKEALEVVIPSGSWELRHRQMWCLYQEPGLWQEPVAENLCLVDFS